jgi:hypothetical protein
MPCSEHLPDILSARAEVGDLRVSGLDRPEEDEHVNYY